MKLTRKPTNKLGRKINVKMKKKHTSVGQMDRSRKGAIVSLVLTPFSHVKNTFFSEILFFAVLLLL